jgi:hypothetical protein
MLVFFKNFIKFLIIGSSFQVLQCHDLDFIQNMSATVKERQLHVTIARYNEDISHLSWLRHVPHTIYNRGGPLPEYFNVIEQLENVGRESFIYFQHIVRAIRNNRTAKYNVFSQASQSVTNLFSEDDFKNTVFKLMVDELSLTPENDGFAFLIPICWYSFYALNYYGNHEPIKPDDANYNATKMVFLDSYKDHLNFTVECPRYAPTAVFVATGDAILRNSMDYYVHLGRLVGTENNPSWGFFFEQAWPEVFHSTCSVSEQYECVLHNPYAYQLPKNLRCSRRRLRGQQK